MSFESAQQKQAKNTIEGRIQLGSSKRLALIKSCAENIPKDRYVHPKKMRFGVDKQGQLILQYDRSDRGQDPFTQVETVTIHRNALSQLSETAGIDHKYVGRLLKPELWRTHLLAYNLNTLFEKQRFLNRAKQEASFLHRLVGHELRGFLTQSYNRHLISQPLLASFLEACNEVGAKPVDALISDVKVGLQCYLPVAFEPIPGEFIAMGVWWGNSDFGAGKLRVSHTVMRMNGSSTLLEDSWSRVHLGGVVQESDIILSDEVARKEIEAVSEAIKSAVKTILAASSIQKIIDAIAQAHEEQIPWISLQGQLKKILSKEQVTSVQKMLDDRIQDLPPPGMDKNGKPLVSHWWASSAISRLADFEVDSGRRSDLQQYAGSFLKEKKKDE